MKSQKECHLDFRKHRIIKRQLETLRAKSTITPKEKEDNFLQIKTKTLDKFTRAKIMPFYTKSRIYADNHQRMKHHTIVA